MALLSIIVPVFNKEKYIDDCLLSILNQNFKDFELILVNDGSTDESLSKCRHYKDRDPRVTIIDQDNAGVSIARNAGLNYASGRYIGFVDSDDTIEPDMHEMLIKNAEAFEADISVCRIRTVIPGKITPQQENSGTIFLNHEEALLADLNGDLDRNVNNKIFKAEIAQQIKFEGHIYEDILYNCRAFLIAGKTVLEDAVKYNYIIRDNSVSMSRFNPKYFETIMVSSKIVEMVANESTSCLNEAQIFDIVTNISLLNLLLLRGKVVYTDEYNKVVNNLLRYRPFIRQSAALRKKYKYAIMMFFASPWLYTWGMYAYCVLTKSEVIKRTE